MVFLHNRIKVLFEVSSSSSINYIEEATIDERYFRRTVRPTNNYFVEETIGENVFR